MKQEDVGSKLNIFKEALSTMQNLCSRKQADSSFRQFGQDAHLYESFKLFKKGFFLGPGGIPC